MLIKELSKKSLIPPKGLLIAPVGLICYIIDCLNSGYSIEDVNIKLMSYSLSAYSIQEVLYNDVLMDMLITDYAEFKSLNCVLNLF